MRVPIYSIVKRLVPGLVLGFVVLIGLALLGNLRQVSQLLLDFHWEFFPIAIGFILLSFTLRFLKWRFYLGQIGIRRLSWTQDLRLFLAGFPLTVVPGKIGEALQSVWLNRMYKIPVGQGISMILIERISNWLALILLSVLGVILYPQYWPFFALIFVTLLAVIVLFQIRPTALWLVGVCEKIPLLNRSMHGLREFYEGSFALFRPGATLLAVLIGSTAWLSEGICFYCIFLGLGLPPGLQLLVSAIFVLVFSTAVGAASKMPGGLGVVEISIAGLVALGLRESPAVATSATLLIRLATLWFSVAIGLFTWSFSKDLLGMKVEQGSPAEA
jgi:glycosyltransferase 2 family protein